MKNLLLTCVALCAAAALSADSLPARPAEWAQPLRAAGAPNLHRVSGALYRSAQPTAEGFRSAAALGVKTVVNLRSFNSDRGKLAGTGLRYQHIAMKAWHPEREDVVRFLRIVTDSAQTPVLVHCQHGADRTGTMCAVYRIAVQGWTKEAALREMTEGGYHFHGVWQNLLAWINGLDIAAVKQAAGLR
ncbi:MAG TPA: dual specificity protein phosphatase family protein [Candidatus Edwardsbacteria bacterium]|nr:dual specificity protein phosphatase family protein [Candidatus Edwardsbacteria bacterium]